MSNLQRINSMRYRWMILILALPLMAGSVAARKEEPAPSPTATPLVLQSLESVIRNVTDRETKLTADLAELDRRIDELAVRKARAKTCLVRDVMRESGLAQLAFIGLIVWICLWTYLLMVMVGRMRGDEWAAKRKAIRWLFIGFIALGALCIITGIADASGQIGMPETFLPGTIDRIHEYGKMDPWRKVLMSLENQQCCDIVISDEVLKWIRENCPEGIEIQSNLSGKDVDNPDRVIAGAAIYWASGDREKALNLMAPFLKWSYNHYDDLNRQVFMTVLRFHVEVRNEAETIRIADKMKRSLSPSELVELARIVRRCTFSTAMEYLDLAKKRARTPGDVISVSEGLNEFNKSYESQEFLKSNLDMSLHPEGMKAFLEYARQKGLTDFEKDIIEKNIDARNRPESLMELARDIMEQNYTADAVIALNKAIEKSDEERAILLAIAHQALEWKFLDVTEKALQAIIDSCGIEGAIMPFPDPHVLDVAPPGAAPDPSVGIVRAMLAQNRGDTETAGMYYTEMLNFELDQALACGRFPGGINCTNFFYPYRFFLSKGDTEMIARLDSIGRQIEIALISDVDKSGIEALESDIKSARERIAMLEKDNSRIRLRQAVDWIFRFFFFVFMLCFAAVLIAAQVVIIRRTIAHVKRLDHLRVLGAVMKLLELEGFVFVASVVFAPAALLVIVYTQVLQAVLFAESHLFRLSEHRRKGKTDEFPKLPLTYRDRE